MHDKTRSAAISGIMIPDRHDGLPGTTHGTPPNASWRILCDFDGTISLQDVTDCLIEKFGRPGCAELEAQWESGRIGSRACLSGQVALLDATREQIDACLDDIRIDAGFMAFIELAREQNVDVQIISDGLDYSIERILRRHDLADLPVVANHLVQVTERRWRLEFPHYRTSCRQASGNCKCASVSLARQSHERILFIGDGSSDFCASGQADFVLAKDRLVGYCREHQIAHAAIADFRDALALLPDILQRLRFAA